MHAIFIVKDDVEIQEILKEFLVLHDVKVEIFESTETFLHSWHDELDARLLLDLTLAEKMDGLLNRSGFS